MKSTPPSRRRKPSKEKRAEFNSPKLGTLIVWNLTDKSVYYPTNESNYHKLIKRLNLEGAKIKYSH